MSVYVTGDTHGHIDLFRLASKKWKDGRDLKEGDYLIILGDFGILWKNVPDDEERYLVNWLNQKRWTTLFVDGNHENHTRLKALPVVDFHGGKAGKVSDKIFHLKRGEIYTLNGAKFFCFGGAVSLDKEHRIEDVSWWKDEVASFAEMDYALINLMNHQYSVDYILAHTLPESVLKLFYKVSYLSDEDATRRFLDHVVTNVHFIKYYCGHFHENATIGKYNILYNNIEKVI